MYGSICACLSVCVCVYLRVCVCVSLSLSLCVCVWSDADITIYDVLVNNKPYRWLFSCLGPDSMCYEKRIVVNIFSQSGPFITEWTKRWFLRNPSCSEIDSRLYVQSIIVSSLRCCPCLYSILQKCQPQLHRDAVTTFVLSDLNANRSTSWWIFEGISLRFNSSANTRWINQTRLDCDRIKIYLSSFSLSLLLVLPWLYWFWLKERIDRVDKQRCKGWQGLNGSWMKTNESGSLQFNNCGNVLWHYGMWCITLEYNRQQQ